MKTFGGSVDDGATAVATDRNGNIYVAGYTRSTDFPVKNAFQPRIGGRPLRVTMDRGKTWSAPAIPDPVLAVTGLAAQPGVLFAGTANGIYKSSDSGRSWRAANAPKGVAVPALVTDVADPNLLFAGTDRGVLRSLDGGATWGLVQQSEPVMAVVSCAAQPASVFAVALTDADTGQVSVYRSKDRGSSWVLLSSAPAEISSVACDRSHPNTIYAGGDAIYRSSDDGTSWTKVADLSVALSTFALAWSGSTMYASTPGGVYVSRDDGNRWTATSLDGFSANVSVDPSDSAVAYADNNGQVYVTADSGATWTRILEVRQYWQTLSVIAGQPSSVFAGASIGQSAFVQKWTPDGELVYSSYLGGSYLDAASAIAVDAQGNAYVAGSAASSDFPVTVGSLDPKNTDTNKAFVAKISPDGEKLIYGTYFGGMWTEPKAMAVDATGSVYLTGFIQSMDLPVTAGAVRKTIRADCDSHGFWPKMGFVAKLSTDGDRLVYSTYLGGTCSEEATGIAVDGAGSAFVVGRTSSPEFPVSPGALKTNFGDAFEQGFLLKLSPQGSAFEQATFMGNNENSSASGVALDAKGDVYVAASFGGFEGGASVVKLNSSATAKLYDKCFGWYFALASAVAVDGAGRAWLMGRPLTTFLPTVRPFQAERGATFVGLLSSDGADILFASFVEFAQGISVDRSGNAVLAGISSALQLEPADGVVLKIAGSASAAVSLDSESSLQGANNDSHREAGISPGEIVVLTGSGLGPAIEFASSQLADGSLPTTLSGTTVRFDGIQAALVSVQDKKVVCIAPASIPDSPIATTTVQLRSDAGESNRVVFPTVRAHVEILGVQAAGDVLSIYAAGLGRVTLPQPQSTSPYDLFVSIEGPRLAVWDSTITPQKMEIAYFGAAPGQPDGIKQINAKVPANLAAGYYDVRVIGGDSYGSYLMFLSPAAVLDRR